MEITTYQKEAARTCARIDNGIIDDMHMVLGMQTEVAEIADVYKKYIAYEKKIRFSKHQRGNWRYYVVFCQPM